MSDMSETGCHTYFQWGGSEVSQDGSQHCLVSHHQHTLLLSLNLDDLQMGVGEVMRGCSRQLDLRITPSDSQLVCCCGLFILNNLKVYNMIS